MKLLREIVISNNPPTNKDAIWIRENNSNIELLFNINGVWKNNSSLGNDIDAKLENLKLNLTSDIAAIYNQLVNYDGYRQEIDALNAALNDETTYLNTKIDYLDKVTDNVSTDISNLRNVVDPLHALVSDINNRVLDIEGNQFTAEEKEKLTSLENYDDTELRNEDTRLNGIINNLHDLVIEIDTNKANKNEIKTKQDIIPISNETAASKEIEPNKYYKWGEVSSLTVSLATPINTNIYNEYMFEFISGTTPTALNILPNVKGNILTIQPNKLYQCSIVNNYIVMGEFDYE